MQNETVFLEPFPAFRCNLFIRYRNKKDFHFNLGYKSHIIHTFVTKYELKKSIDNLKTQRCFLSFVILILIVSCQVTETIHINPDGSGTIETVNLRDEQSYMQLMGSDYAAEEKFIDTTYVFIEYITKYAADFVKLPVNEKEIFNKYKDVKVHIKKSSFDKEFRTTISLNFDKIENVPDLYKTENYADNLKHNYALAAEEHYYAVSYTFIGNTFKRKIIITDQEELTKQQKKIQEIQSQLAGFKLVQTYALCYHFSQKIKSVSNSRAILSDDKKSLRIEFALADCYQNPEITALEVILD